MKNSGRLVKVYVGPLETVNLLKSNLLEAGIESLVKNDSSLAYMGNVPSVIDLYIDESDLQEAAPIINRFLK
jgi:hypothetical protein